MAFYAVSYIVLGMTISKSIWHKTDDRTLSSFLIYKDFNRQQGRQRQPERDLV